MPPAMPGFVITAKVRWEGTPEPLDAQLFFFSPALAMHALPCILEELVDGSREPKNEQIVKIRLLVPQALPAFPPKTEFKLQYNPAHVCGEGIIEDT